jgi:hypothetical protein
MQPCLRTQNDPVSGAVGGLGNAKAGELCVQTASIRRAVVKRGVDNMLGRAGAHELHGGAYVPCVSMREQKTIERVQSARAQKREQDRVVALGGAAVNEPIAPLRANPRSAPGTKVKHHDLGKRRWIIGYSHIEE